MTKPLPTGLSFEDALKRLEQIINKLEEGDLTLEDSVGLYEEGQQLTAFCQQLLDNAELRVRELTADD